MKVLLFVLLRYVYFFLGSQRVSSDMQLLWEVAGTAEVSLG